MAVDLSAWAGKYSPAVLNAAQRILAAKPEQVAQNSDANGFNLDQFINGTVGWWDSNGWQVEDQLQNFQPEMALLDAVQSDPVFAGPAAGQVPIEQSLGSYVTDLGKADINNDPARQDYINNLIASYASSRQGAQNTIASLQPTEPGGQSAMLQSELGASGVAKDQQLAALTDQLHALSGSLTGDLAAKATNLATQLATLTQANTNFTADQKAALAAQVTGQLGNLNAEVASKRDAITTELATMGQGITAQDQARRAALQTELTQLNAAQAPLNAARVAGANTIGAAVNLAAQAQKDAIQAQAAQSGYIGSSTGTDMALARAGIGGRQQAAAALANANVANETDNAAIGKYGANTQYGIADTTAGQNQSLTNFGATENRTLSDYGATQGRGIADFGTNTTAAIDNTAATNKLNVAGFGAGETRTLGDFGADQARAQTDYGAGETRNIKDSAAGRDLSFFSNDIQRRLATLNLPNQAISDDIKIQQAADDYGQSGLTRFMKNLGFFQTNGGNAPAAQVIPTAPAQDSGFQNIGAGLISAAGGIAAGNNYWAPPKSTAPISTAGAGSYADMASSMNSLYN